MNESSLNSMLDNLYKANYCYNCNKLDRRKIRFRFDFNPFVQFILSLSLSSLHAFGLSLFLISRFCIQQKSLLSLLRVARVPFYQYKTLDFEDLIDQ